MTNLIAPHPECSTAIQLAAAAGRLQFSQRTASATSGIAPPQDAKAEKCRGTKTSLAPSGLAKYQDSLCSAAAAIKSDTVLTARREFQSCPGTSQSQTIQAARHPDRLLSNANTFLHRC